MSAFMFYSQDHRAHVQEQNPDVTFGQIGRILGFLKKFYRKLLLFSLTSQKGDHWKKLPDADREKYLKRSEEDRQRYFVSSFVKNIIIILFVRYYRDMEKYKSSRKQPESTSESEDEEEDDEEEGDEE